MGEWEKLIKFEQSMTIDQCTGGDHCVVCFTLDTADCSENIMELCNAALKLYGNEK